jgi:flagellar hook-basal body complex protein FliE
MVKNFTQNAIDKSEMSEQLSAAAAAGKANIDQVVIAVAEAESTLNTVVAVRDKVLDAYREILRMPI